jgi:cation efflux system protein involved in nickel and cobalt tolerance
VTPFSSDSAPQPQPPYRRVRRRKKRQQGSVTVTLLVLLTVGWLGIRAIPRPALRQIQEVVWVNHPEPLVMEGGDPYLRALMRTISAAESNTSAPYTILYGGESFDPVNRHPNICVPITVGPNTGDCTTAAGRYQFLSQTWAEKAEKYHPHPPAWYEVWGEYSFDPEAQDLVVYQWLKDTNAWGFDIPTALREDRLEDVLRRLSGTWTSLGYGIESNSMTARLPRIYRSLLEEELQNASTGALPGQEGR